MSLRLGFPLAVVALLLGASAAAAEPSIPLARTLGVASRDDPHAGKVPERRAVPSVLICT